MATNNTADFYRRPHLTTAAFALGLLLFLLPFFDIQCNNISMAKLSGVDMATGARPSLSRELQEMQRGFSDKDNGEVNPSGSKDGAEGKFFITALIALALGVIGLVFSLLTRGRSQRPAMLIGALGAIALIGAWVQVGSHVKENAKTQRGAEDLNSSFSTMMNVSASPTFWFILCLLCYLAAAYFGYRQSALPNTNEAPAAAPQLPLNNPGDQSEFPATPQDARGLG